jgi:hypothetical protein
VGLLGWRYVGPLVCSLALSAAGCAQSSLSVTAPGSDKCQVSARGTPTSFPHDGGAGTLAITTTRDCEWTIRSEVEWIALDGGPARNGQGEAAIAYQVTANQVPVARLGAIVAASHRIQIAQAAAPCRFELSRPHEVVGPAGASLSIDVVTLTGCAWRATSQAAWIDVVSGASCTASGRVGLTVAANEGPSRVGAVVIADQTFTVEQQAGAGPLPPAPDPPALPPDEPDPDPDQPDDPAPDDPDPDADVIQLEGAVEGLAGSCPQVAFQLAGWRVETDSNTEFRDGRCRDLSNGDTVRVVGVVVPGGIVDADRLEFRDDRRRKD